MSPNDITNACFPKEMFNTHSCANLRSSFHQTSFHCQHFELSNPIEVKFGNIFRTEISRIQIVPSFYLTKRQNRTNEKIQPMIINLSMNRSISKKTSLRNQYKKKNFSKTYWRAAN